VYLANYASKVTIMIRRESLKGSMSSYLIEQIADTDNIEVRGNTEITAAIGEEKLEKLALFNNQTGERYEEAADAVFVFIGNRPNTSWLEGQLLRDEKGFLLTGRAVMQHPNFEKIWKENREPMDMETCVPGIFAVGDVRSGAINRVATAVGEGSMSIKMTHNYLRMK
jgi:thioredoxin reductase (NADPH)